MAHPDFSEALLHLFDAERKVRACHDELAAIAPGDHPALLNAVEGALGPLLAGSDDQEDQDEAEAEACLRLVCLARLLGEYEGDKVVDLLIDVLASEHPEARAEAGEQLQGLAYHRFKEVGLGVERALSRLPAGSPALVELPYVLVELPEEAAVMKLLGLFLKHADADAVAAGIEALVELGNPAAARLLVPLQDDTRTSSVSEDDGLGPVHIGELAAQAMELLSEDGPPDADA